MKNIAIFLIFALTTIYASATRFFPQELKSNFEAGQCELSPSEAVVLTTQVQRYRDLHGIISLPLFLEARVNDPASIDLALCRAKSLMKLLRPIVHAQEIVPIELYIRVRAVNELDLGTSNAAVVEPQPTCTRTGQCGPIPIEKNADPP